MRRPLALALLLTSLAAAGCGDQAQQAQDLEQPTRNSQSGPLVLPADDVASVVEAQRTIATACDADQSITASSAEGPDELTAAVDEVARITKDQPDDRFETGQTDTPQTMTSVAKDLAAQLERCGRTPLAEQLRGVATGDEPVQKGTPGY